MVVRVALALALCGATARVAAAQAPEATPGYAGNERCTCIAGTIHAGEEFPCGTSSCVCNDACGSGGGGGAAMVDAIETAIIGVCLLVAAPAAFLDVGKSEGDKDKENAAAAQALEAYHQQIAALEQRGRDAASARQAFREGVQREELRDAVGDQPVPTLLPLPRPQGAPNPAATPALDEKADLEFRCREAGATYAMHFQFTGPGGLPLAGFANETQMLQQCCTAAQPCAPPVDSPAPVNGVCPAGNLQGTSLNGPVCCPADHPIYNACDQQCFETTDFRGAAGAQPAAGIQDEAGLNCLDAVDVRHGYP